MYSSAGHFGQMQVRLVSCKAPISEFYTRDIFFFLSCSPHWLWEITGGKKSLSISLQYEKCKFSRTSIESSRESFIILRKFWFFANKKRERNDNCSTQLIDRTVSGEGGISPLPPMMTFEGCSHSLLTAELGNHYFLVNLINLTGCFSLQPLLGEIWDADRKVTVKCWRSTHWFGQLE